VTSNVYYHLQIVKRETIIVPAGSFDTFRIEGDGWNVTAGSHSEMKMWLVPGLNFEIKLEFVSRPRDGGFNKTSKSELVSIRQQVIDSECATFPGGPQANPNLKNSCG
jgi:hypothetical protein